MEVLGRSPRTGEDHTLTPLRRLALALAVLSLVLFLPVPVGAADPLDEITEAVEDVTADVTETVDGLAPEAETPAVGPAATPPPPTPQTVAPPDPPPETPAPTPGPTPAPTVTPVPVTAAPSVPPIPSPPPEQSERQPVTSVWESFTDAIRKAVTFIRTEIIQPMGAVDPVTLARLVTLAVAALLVRRPDLVAVPREVLRRKAHHEVRTDLRVGRSAKAIQDELLAELNGSRTRRSA